MVTGLTIEPFIIRDPGNIFGIFEDMTKETLVFMLLPT